MASKRPKASRQIIRALLREAHDKCANPGCQTKRTHIHHIHEWETYQTHDEKYMIAICPTCHDSVHHGSLEITDETLCKWKGLNRKDHNKGVLYIEPGEKSCIQLGTTEINTPGGVTIFKPSKNNQLSYKVEGGDIILINCSILDSSGKTIIEIIDSRTNFLGDKDKYQYLDVTGHLKITGQAQEIVEPWMIKSIRKVDPEFAKEPEIILEVEVIDTGKISIQGIWCGEGKCLVVKNGQWIIPKKKKGIIHFTQNTATINLPRATIDMELFKNFFAIW